MKQLSTEYTIIDHLITSRSFSYNDISLNQIREYLEMNPDVLKTRKRPVVMIRRYLSFIIHKKLNITSIETAKILGGRDHATVLYAVRRHADSLEVKDKLYKDIIQKVNWDLKKLEIKHVLTIK